MYFNKHTRTHTHTSTDKIYFTTSKSQLLSDYIFWRCVMLICNYWSSLYYRYWQTCSFKGNVSNCIFAAFRYKATHLKCKGIIPVLPVIYLFHPSIHKKLTHTRADCQADNRHLGVHVDPSVGWYYSEQCVSPWCLGPHQHGEMAVGNCRL